MTKEEILDWDKHPVTIAFKHQIKEDIFDGYQALKISIIDDAYNRSSLIVGKIQAYEDILEMEITAE